MDATPTTTGFEGATGRGLAPASLDEGAAAALRRKWLVLHEAARAVAGIAGVGVEPLRGEAERFPALICETGGWRCELARQGIDDISAMLEPGLSALLAACSRGADCAAPAKALWREFVLARDAVLALAPPDS